jgi:ECF sigma factor
MLGVIDVGDSPIERGPVRHTISVATDWVGTPEAGGSAAAFRRRDRVAAGLERGDEGAFDALVPLVYAELRRLARLYMRHERRGLTLQPTALVNEAYLRLVDIQRVSWQDRATFLRRFGARDAPAVRRHGTDTAGAETSGWHPAGFFRRKPDRR